MKRQIVAVAIIAALSAPMASINASPGEQTTWTYYSDDTHTTVVGWRTFTCQGRTIKWGVETPHFEITDQYFC